MMFIHIILGGRWIRLLLEWAQYYDIFPFIRETGPKDARTTVVRLSDYGWETVEELRTEIYGQINRLIDTIGMERLIEFTSIAKEITEVIEKPPKTILNTLLSGD